MTLYLATLNGRRLDDARPDHLGPPEQAARGINPGAVRQVRYALEPFCRNTILGNPVRYRPRRDAEFCGYFFLGKAPAAKLAHEGFDGRVIHRENCNTEILYFPLSFFASFKIQKKAHTMLDMNEAHPKNIAPRLRNLRMMRGLTQRRLCEELGLGVNTYNHYERGNNRPDVTNALILCDFYGVTLDYLFTGNKLGLQHGLAREIELFEATDPDRQAG